MISSSTYIRQARKDLRLTQLQLATLTGSKRNNIAKYETGRAMPPGDFILKIQQFLALRIEQATDGAVTRLELLYPEEKEHKTGSRQKRQ